MGPSAGSGVKPGNCLWSSWASERPDHWVWLINEVEFAFGAEAEARVTTDYRPEPGLAMFVPAEMKEHFADVANAKVKTFPARFNGVASYERFRRFTVSTEAQVAVPPQP